MRPQARHPAVSGANHTPLPGMLVHQDGSTHEWISGQKWDLIETMDDATNDNIRCSLSRKKAR